MALGLRITTLFIHLPPLPTPGVAASSPPVTRGGAGRFCVWARPRTGRRRGGRPKEPRQERQLLQELRTDIGSRRS